MFATNNINYVRRVIYDIDSIIGDIYYKYDSTPRPYTKWTLDKLLS